MAEGLDLDKITRDAQAYVASLSDADVLRKLTDKQRRDDKKKAKLAEAKALKKAIDAALAARMANGETDQSGSA